jgi:MEDS: MEthanogen/methylotroph, DcmR Sensory domain
VAYGARPDRATGHFVRFYHDEPLLVDEVVDFAREALYFGGCSVLIATRAHLSAMTARLAVASREREQEARNGLVSIDAHAALAGFMVEGWPDEARFFATIGSLMAKARAVAMNGPVHTFGEMVAVLCEQGQYDAALRVEVLWNALAGQHSFTLFCAYPHTLFRNAEQSRIFEHICNAHTRVLPSEVLMRP